MQELFIYDEPYYKRFAYELIEEFKNKGQLWDGEINEEGTAVITLSSLDDTCWLSEYEGMRKTQYHYYDMRPTVGRDVYNSGEVNYWLAYGDMGIYLDSRFEYSLKGAYLHEEEKGKIQEFVDQLIAMHPEWKEA